MPRSRGERDKVFVTLGTLQYGFLASNNSRPYRAALGHTAYDNQTGVVFGANSPKPNRATKEVTANDVVSSFCDPGQEATLKADGWIINGGGRRRGLARTPRSRTVFVDMGTYNYGWNLTTGEHQYMAELGIEFASGSTPTLVFGSTPKPPRATRKINGRVVSTFIAPIPAVLTAAETAGWSISDPYGVLPEDA
ncbi:hypothetical protein H6F67_14070 [Microcoleus sp. FACHB-1515]|uniref:hypothetical protein n=1 Tax=Cyanophyceae TaxID=3028117 RepID=UPI001686D65E|nr:hypothetical protein [Microcoleus sp. FACHB-1515]MBD2090978.1 hypothetical protein [Microcoleus sp. FACHB-1515]